MWRPSGVEEHGAGDATSGSAAEPAPRARSPRRAPGPRAPRADASFAHARKISHVDDLAVWSAWCIRVRPGHRGEGISHALLSGAVDFARDHEAPAIEGYPVDNGGEKVDLTMAYVGTKTLFEKAGFVQAAETESRLAGFPRVLMRLDLS